MRKIRRAYYDLFSKIYDKIIALHSKDTAGELRSFLSQQVDNPNNAPLLDICTGTGSVASRLRKDHGVTVAGLDFSWGMLTKAKAKDPEVCWVLGSVTNMPFKSSRFGAVTCSHAFYELKGQEPFWALAEAKRVLKPKGSFLMMEHETPTHPFVKLLYYIRLFALGSLSAASLRSREEELFSRFFGKVERLSSPTGRSTLIIAKKEE
jgi:ubiquinone/menaquinone biosynthesis C-methylase UbiE